MWDDINFDNPRATLEAAARVTLEGLREEADLFRIMQRDGHDFPDLVAEVHDRLIGRGYDSITELFRRVLGAHDPPDDDLVALAAIALGSLVHFRDDAAIYEKIPAGADEADFVRVWTRTWTHVLTSPFDV